MIGQAQGNEVLHIFLVKKSDKDCPSERWCLNRAGSVGTRKSFPWGIQYHWQLHLPLSPCMNMNTLEIWVVNRLALPFVHFVVNKDLTCERSDAFRHNGRRKTCLIGGGLFETLA